MPNWIIICHFLIHVIGWIMTLYDVHVLNPPEPGSLHVKSNVHMWLQIWGWGYFVLDDPVGSNVITKALKGNRVSSRKQEVGVMWRRAMSQGSTQPLETKWILPKTSQWTTAPLNLDFRLLTSRTVKKYIYVVSSHQLLVIGTVAIGN